jgi:glucose/arabinose dehydrogenase
MHPCEPRLLLAAVPAGFTETQLAAGLTSPTALDVAPDGRVFFTDQSGHVRVIDHDQLQPAPFADLSAQTDGGGERGMLGVALDPDFVNNRYVYVYYTANAPASHNRLSRLTADPTNPNVMIPGSERILFDFPNIGTAIWHMGGSIQFGPDQKLYLAVGDHQQSANSQSLSSVFGKILRVNPDGTIPADNPFYNQTTGINQSIWALGLRNPFTTAFQPGTGRFFLNDVGEGTWEELDDGVAGRNYGWPTTEGDFNPATYPNFTRPFHTYQHTLGRSCIIGGAFYNPAVNQFPAPYAGKYFFADFTSGEMWTIDPATKAFAPFATGMSFPDAIDLGADGTLYYMARGAGAGGQPGIGTGGVYKIQYAANLPPTIAQSPQNRLVSVGQPATFTVAASGTAPLAYQWTRDGVDIPGATASSYTLSNTTTSDHGAVFRARVTNDFGTATSDPATLSVTTNAPPVATINTPADGATYRAGDTITYAGSGADAEDGNLPPSALTWWVDFHHHDHVHPFVAPVTGSAGGTFTIPTTGESDADVWYRVHLTVTDSIGLQHHVYRDVTPVTAALTINSNLPGNVPFTLDGQTKSMPLTVQGVANLTRTVGVNSVVSVGGQWYAFAGWSDGGARTHSFPFPAANTTLTATFTPLGAGVYVSDLPFAAPPVNGWGPVERDRSNGETGAADGKTLTLNGVTYAKGLGVHAVTAPAAPARVTVNLDGGFTRFLSDVGVDDEVANAAGSVVFQVFADGVKVYDSGTMTATSPTQSVDVSVDGVRQLDLVITDAGNGNASDHGDWAGALLLRRPGPAGPAAHYEFDDAAGATAADLSTNANHAAVNGTAAWVPGYVARNALAFDGSTTFVTAPNAPQLNPTQALTLAAWINPTTWAGGFRRVVQKGDTNLQYRLAAINGQLQWFIAGVGFVSTGLPSAGAWHHVAATYDGATLRLFVDGAPVAAAPATGPIPTGPDPLAVGGRNGGTDPSERFSGTIDDVRVYDRALNLQETYDLAHPISINFQIVGAPTPAGYLPDTGLTYADRGNGQTYGWSSDHTDTARDRNVNPDPRLDTLNQLKAGQRWEIGLPNGTYRVYVSVGDPSFGNFTPTLNIEGVNAFADLTLAANGFQFVSRTVTVADGRLTLDQGPDADKELRLNYVQIYSLNADVTAPAVTASQFVYQQPAAPGRAHGVRFTFGENLADLTASDLQLVNLTTGVPVPAASIEMTWNAGVALFTFPGYPGGLLPDGDYRATLPAGSATDAAGNPLAAPVTLDFFVLAADANRDRAVNFNDLLALARNYNAPGKTWADGDFNYDGTVNFSDLLILARSYNKALPAQSPPVMALATPRSTTPSLVRDPAATLSVFSAQRVLAPTPAKPPVKARHAPKR